jgi:APA family basic amino acid/polyamine antiporter
MSTSAAAPSASSTDGPPVKAYTRNATGLVREARLIDQIALNLGANTPLTSALAVGLFTIAAFPRMNVYIALLVPALLSVPIWITWSLFAATFPKTGGDYIYNSRILTPAIGLGVNLGFMFASVLSAGFAASFLPELAINPTLLIIGTVTHSHSISNFAGNFAVSDHWGVFLTSVAGILLLCVLGAIRSKLVLRVMSLMVGIFAVAAIIDIVILLFTSNSSFIHTFNHYAGAGGYQKVVHAAAGKGLYPSEGGYSFKQTLGAMFVWVGFSIWVWYGAYINGEVRRAGDRKRMLTSVVGSGVLQTVFVLISIFVFYHAIGQDFAISAAAGNQSTGVATFPYYAALATGNSVIAVVISVAFLLWALPVLSAIIAPISRGLFVYSFERLLPPWVSRVNPKTHTPVYAIAITAFLAVLDSAFNSFNANFSVALTLAELPGFFVMFFVAISALVMRRRRPQLYNGSQADWKIAGVPVLPIAGALSVVISAGLIVLPFFYQKQLGLNSHSWLPTATAIAPVAAIVIGVIWWYIARARNRAHGIDLNLLYKTIPPD